MMTRIQENELSKVEQDMMAQCSSPRACFDAASAAKDAGNTEKATRYLRMALNTYDTQLLNQFDLKSLGEPNNA